MIKTIVFTILFALTAALAVMLFAIIDFTFWQFLCVYIGFGVVLFILGSIAWKGNRYAILNI